MNFRVVLGKYYYRAIFFCAVISTAFCLAIFGFTGKGATLIAPMIDGQSKCEEAINDPNLKSDDQADALCNKLGKNGAKGIAKVLDALGPERSPSGRFELGYTLIMPLLRFYVATGDGWQIDQHSIDVALSTIKDIERPVVLHLSATHFNSEGQAFAAALDRDARNLMWTKDGPLRPNDYFTTPIHAWTLADDNAPVNRYRREAFSAVLDSVCRLPDFVRQRIAAVTFLGETHQLFPDLQGKGASYRSDYLITDYSPASRAGFRTWLRMRFGTIRAMNQQIGGSFRDFNGVEPPSENLITAADPDRLRHLDEFAAGSIAILGWAAAREATTANIDIYVDGIRAADVSADMSRLDVLDARPDLGSRNVGWRYDLDYTKLSPGVHDLDFVATVGSRSYFLGKRKVMVLGNNVSNALTRSRTISATRPLDLEFSGFIDHPDPEIRVLYNPLARLWNEYRFDQVTRFQEQFGRIAQRSCIPKDELFSHQIATFLYPDYNEQKIASGKSLKSNAFYNPGITMYGGSAYGDQFFRFKASNGWNKYGIGEFHPLVKLTPSEYIDMFNRHNRAGAAYIAPFYLSVFDAAARPAAMAADLISPNNSQKGSRELYHAISELMHKE